jgi:maltooligosyltrehalose synthase
MQGRTMIVAVGRRFAHLAPRADELCPAPEVWRNTLVHARTAAPGWRDVLTGAPVISGERSFAAEDLFRELPAAVLVAEG